MRGEREAGLRLPAVLVAMLRAAMDPEVLARLPL